MNKIFLSLGTNLGDRGVNLKEAILSLEKWGIKVIRSSSIYETEPVGFKDQPWFYNMVLEVETEFGPEELLAVLLRIEREMGRKRQDGQKWGPRIIDLDLLFYGDKILPGQENENQFVPTAEAGQAGDKTEQVIDKLILPHPRIAERKFVLLPLAEIAGDFVYPKISGNSFSNKKISQLLNDCHDVAIVRPL